MKNNPGYHGIVAETYDLWFQSDCFEEERKFYRHMLEEVSGLALEVGCGTGRLLIPYLRDGLHVEGIDSSADMLDICRKRADLQGLLPVLYKQHMQQLDLSEKYNTIYVPAGSFMLVSDRVEAMETIRRFYSHLLPGGQVLMATSLAWGKTRIIPYKDRPAQPQKVWALWRVSTQVEDGVTILVHEAVENDYVEQLQQGWYKYEVYLDGNLIHTYLQPMKLRWYSKHELILMLEKVGFRDIHVYGDYTNAEASEAHQTFIFRAWR